jgi:DNA (cytosine-5)-methyltransferase 1
MNNEQKDHDLQVSQHSSNEMLSDAFSHGSLFSGIGGFDLAASWMGWDNIFNCEKDEWCRKVLKKNFPATKQFSDIKDFNAKEYEGRIDVISGGFPCQPFSVAGKQRGKDDDRYLWEEMLRVVGDVKPSFVVGENVTGIIGMALDTVLSDLEAQGYTTETFIIPACGKNAWHKRDRVWIVAYSDSIRRHYEQKENREFIYNGKRNGETEKQGRQQQQCRTGESSIISADTTSSGTRLEEYRSSGQTRELSNELKPKILRQKNGQISSEGINPNSGNIPTNPDNAGCEEQRQSITTREKFFAPQCSSWWEAEPGMGRVVDGLSRRVDRLKGLGNAIVPQVAFEIFKAVGTVLMGIR